MIRNTRSMIRFLALGTVLVAFGQAQAIYAQETLPASNSLEAESSIESFVEEDSDSVFTEQPIEVSFEENSTVSGTVEEVVTTDPETVDTRNVESTIEVEPQDDELLIAEEEKAVPGKQILVSVSQKGEMLQLSYNGSVSKTGQLMYAVWTEDRSQDDLRWYVADKRLNYNVDLSKAHRAYGFYNIHTYLSDKGKMLGLNATKFEVKKPKVTMTVVKKNDNEYQVKLSGLTSEIVSVDTPIWTEHKQQDDIVWQGTKKEPNGLYTTTIQLSKHNYESGQYNVHAYGYSKITGRHEGLLASSHVVKQLPVTSKVTKFHNDYTVTLSNVPSYLQAVKVPIWSMRDGQDDIVWYVANKQANGSYVATFNLSKHKSNIGDYAIHAYGQTNTGKMSGLLATSYKVVDLEVKQPAKYKQHQTVEIQGYATHESNGYYLVPHQNWIGTVKAVNKNVNNAVGGWEYHIVYDNGQQNVHVLEQDIRFVYHVNLKATNNRTQNNQALQSAFDYAKAHRDVTLYLPKGDYVIGSSISESQLSPHNKSEYVTLASNTKLRGNDKGTNLVVDGTMLWFGLPTGQNGVDGVSNLTLDNLHVRAKDERNGNYFMVMLNHGNNILVQRSSFTMVQKQSRHIFDLGGVQNVTFKNNKFVGYAPELTHVHHIPPGIDLHKFYAEAIQLDYANNHGGWDAGMIRRIAPQAYQAHNRNTVLSNNISILYNQFLPFYKDGRLVAYSSTVGQHSSQVGNVTILGNRFEKTLTSRYHHGSWIMKPIHYMSAGGTRAIVRDNVII